MGQAFDDVPNVYARHVPYFMMLIDDIIKGKSRDNEYQSALDGRLQFSGPDSVNCVILYIIGGATFSELNAMNDLRGRYPGIKFYLGSTHIINSKQFLKQVNQFYIQANPGKGGYDRYGN